MYLGKNSVSGSALDLKNITLVYLKAPSVLDRVTKVQRHICEADILETKSDTEFHHYQKLRSICYQVFSIDFCHLFECLKSTRKIYAQCSSKIPTREPKL